jgi:hypothetical protein
MTMSSLRTPLWREQTKSVAEQFETAWWAETNRDKDVLAIRAAFAGTHWETMTDEELEAFRDEMIDDIDSGRVSVELPVNNLIKLFLTQSNDLSWIVYALEWAVVRSDDVEFILGDTPVSRYDPTPPYPGSAPGIMSSPNAQMFIPLDPSFGILAQPHPDKIKTLWDLTHKLPKLTDEERVELLSGHEGGWAEAVPHQAFAHELNLRTYAHAQRYVFGSQQAVCESHRHAKDNAPRLIALAPAPPRLHILEEDPDQPGLMRAWKVFEPAP